jgi:hypothetical protein
MCNVILSDISRYQQSFLSFKVSFQIVLPTYLLLHACYMTYSSDFLFTALIIFGDEHGSPLHSLATVLTEQPLFCPIYDTQCVRSQPTFPKSSITSDLVHPTSLCLQRISYSLNKCNIKMSYWNNTNINIYTNIHTRRQLQMSGFDFRLSQIFWEVVGLICGPLNLVSTTEEVLGRKCNGCGLENREYSSRDPSRWPRDTPLPAKVGTNFT